MSPKTTSPPEKPPNAAAKPNLRGAGAVELAEQWKEARRAYPLYAALATQFELAPLPHPAGELLPARPTRDVFDSDLNWLHAIDEKVLAYQIRQLPTEILNASEDTLRAFIHRQLRKPDKTPADRDKIDLLLVQYFALCAPENLVRQEIQLTDVATVLRPVLAEADATPLEWCEPLDHILASLKKCQSLRDMMEHGLLEQGRLLKESAGHMFYDPAALVAFCRFNFVLRREFIRLLHADLSAVRKAVEALEAAGVKTVDCRRAGFSAAEPTLQLRHFCENWRQPFQKDYTATSVSRAFEQLLALRADLEEGLARAHGELPAGPAPAEQKPLPQPQAAAEKTETRAEPASPEPASAQGPPKKAPVAVAGGQPVPTPQAEVEKCLEAIWEQLIAAPPSRGQSMSTVVLGDTKVLLSSWEVAAFVSEGSQESEDLRRAVVARALLAVAMDARKRSGDASPLESSLVHAQNEVSYFQGRVEQAKLAKKTEAAVNLGISTKRLSSFIEEAEKLQP